MMFNQLNYRKQARERNRTPTKRFADICTNLLCYSGNLLRIGIEPISCPLWAGHSTIKLPEKNGLRRNRTLISMVTATYSTIKLASLFWARWDLNPRAIWPLVFKTNAINHSATSPFNASCRTWTHNRWLRRPTLYQLS